VLSCHCCSLPDLSVLPLSGARKFPPAMSILLMTLRHFGRYVNRPKAMEIILMDEQNNSGVKAGFRWSFGSRMPSRETFANTADTNGPGALVSSRRLSQHPAIDQPAQSVALITGRNAGLALAAAIEAGQTGLVDIFPAAPAVRLPRPVLGHPSAASQAGQ